MKSINITICFFNLFIFIVFKPVGGNSNILFVKSN